MRWDLESRKLGYNNSTVRHNDPQISFEQELENLKSILSTDQAHERRTRTRNRVILTAIGIVTLVGLLYGYSLMYVFPWN